MKREYRTLLIFVSAFAMLSGISVAAGLDLYNGETTVGGAGNGSSPFSTDNSLKTLEHYHPYVLTPEMFLKDFSLPTAIKNGQGGLGTSIAFLEEDATFNQEAFNEFNKTFKLPDQQVQLIGKQSKLTKSTNIDETMMDVEWAHVIAPQAKLSIITFGNKPMDAKDANVVKKEISDLDPTVISDSHVVPVNWAHDPHNKDMPLYHWISDNYAYFTGSGDWGNAVYAAASLPNAVIVGGTELDGARQDVLDQPLTVNNAWDSEGYGRAKFTAKSTPSEFNYSHSYWRLTPDVAWLGGGPEVIVRTNRGWTGMTGTSLSTPCWAALWALMENRHELVDKKALPHNANLVLYNIAQEHSDAFIKRKSDSTKLGLGLPNSKQLIKYSASVSDNVSNPSVPLWFQIRPWPLSIINDYEYWLFGIWGLISTVYVLKKKKLNKKLSVNDFLPSIKWLVLTGLIVFLPYMIAAASMAIPINNGARREFFMDYTIIWSIMVTSLELLMDMGICKLIERKSNKGFPEKKIIMDA